jgi:small subunit ribosomal protein S20
VKNAIKSAREMIASRDPQKAEQALRQAVRTISKAASKGVLHPRNAARRVARLAKSLAAPS